MQRVVILGPGGAGKSTLAGALARATGIPPTHLDVLFWAPGWQPIEPGIARKRLESVLAKDQWILDGNFLDEREGAGKAHLLRADTVIFLDLPRRICLWRVITRLVKDRGRDRPDLPQGCREAWDLALMRWIWRYPAVERPRILRLLEALPEGIDVRVLRSSREAKRFMESAFEP